MELRWTKKQSTILLKYLEKGPWRGAVGEMR